ncbi:MAG: helix-turn-helix transcriptional regulator [Dehalococcoidia bacterium]|nr:helix-turn-helix transcriptional regulator [Dehalococcoidia bacterium]
MNDDFPILAAVAANPTHPYALLEHLQALGLHVSRSTLYRRVEALAAQGWLDADDIRGESGHYRRALTLSREGGRAPTPKRRLSSAPNRSRVRCFLLLWPWPNAWTPVR